MKSIHIKNFRTHQDTKLELTDGLNCLVGAPDSGKTNIIRSVLWALTNRPLGFRFHSDTTKDTDTSVRIEFKDKSFIELVKSKKGGLYYTSIDEEPLKAIGQDVPSSVSDIANMSELNIQKQLDKHFLICSSPSEVAKVFNRVTRLEKIDKSVSLLTTDINSCNKEIKNLSEQIQNLQSQINEIGDVEQMEQKNEVIIRLGQDIVDMQSKIEKLMIVIDNIESIKEQLSKTEDLKAARVVFTQIEDLDSEISTMRQNMDSLFSYIESIEALYNMNMVFYKSLDNAIEHYQSLEDQYQSLRDQHNDIVRLENILKAIEKTETDMELSNRKLQRKISDYKDFLKRITICPFCPQCHTPIEEHDFNLFLKGLSQ